jgi:diadenosine tetraphosphatase ApaH/serine/threonine PP2A family protein phosphatase
VGHSHVALFFVMPGDGDRRPPDEPIDFQDTAQGAQARAGTRLDLSEGRWLINPGSVGQPRDGLPDAAYAILEIGDGVGGGSIAFHRVRYEIDRTQRLMREVGLPARLVERLSYGR